MSENNVYPDDECDNPNGAPRIHSIHTLFLEKPPCCIGFSPLARDYFIVGTYSLVDDVKQAIDDAEAGSGAKDEAETTRQAQQRDGSLILCRIDGDEIHVIQTLPVPFGVLDIHFSPTRPCVLAATTSTGSIATYVLSPASATSTATSNTTPSTFPSPSHLELTPIATLQAFDPTTIVTSLCWFPSPTPTATDSASLAVTLTTGEVGILTLPSALLTLTAHPEPITVDDVEFEILYTHSLEAWVTTVLPPEWPHSGILSGGDDAVLAYAPLPPSAASIGTPPADSPPIDADSSTSHPSHASQPPLPAWSNKRIHGAGVTAILPISIPHPRVNNSSFAAATRFYLTGSYDDTLRILSVPDGTMVRQPRVLHEMGLGGGVWRIKVLRNSTIRTVDTWGFSATLLVSCMYAGAKVVEIKGVAGKGDEGLERGVLEWTSREVGRMEEHESMCYACDAQAPGDDSGDRNGDRMVVSCSFYDKRLCLWKWPSVGT